MYRNLNPADSRPPRSVESQLRDLTQDLAMAFNTGNFDQAAALFANDGVLMTPGQESAHGRKPIESSLQRLGDAGYSDLRFETTRVENSGEMAMELGRFSMAVHKTDGTVVPERGSYVRVWRRLGAWQVVADSWTRTVQAAGERAA